MKFLGGVLASLKVVSDDAFVNVLILHGEPAFRNISLFFPPTL